MIAYGSMETKIINLPFSQTRNFCQQLHDFKKRDFSTKNTYTLFKGSCLQGETYISP